ncbi:uncharacterized protein LOC108950083 [Ciona intestinalis]
MKISMKLVPFAMLLFLSCVLKEASTSNQQLYKKAIMSLDAPTVRFLRNNMCVVMRKIRGNNRGIARWSKVMFFCRNLEQSTLSTVICNQECMNPVTCRQFRGVKSVPVPGAVNVVTRGGQRQTITLNTACICVAREGSTKSCVRQRS